MQKFSMFLIVVSSIFLTIQLNAGDIDPGRSKIDVISRSTEEKSPVIGEPLTVRITLKDSEGKPVAGINGKDISIFIEENGKMAEKILSGKSGADGIIYSVFKPENTFSEKPMKFAVKVNDIIIQKMCTVNYNEADELVDQAQPLWNGCNRIFRNKTMGQIFVCGNITEISRIKVMLIKNNWKAKITLPVLKLYEWKTDYKTTVSSQPLVISGSPAFDEGRYFGKELAIYKIETQVKAGRKYYFELSIPDSSGDGDNFVNVYRTWNISDGITLDSYPDGMAYFNGMEISKSDLMFYIFYKNEMGKK